MIPAARRCGDAKIIPTSTPHETSASWQGRRRASSAESRRRMVATTDRHTRCITVTDPHAPLHNRCRRPRASALAEAHALTSPVCPLAANLHPSSRTLNPRKAKLVDVFSTFPAKSPSAERHPTMVFFLRKNSGLLNRQHPFSHLGLWMHKQYMAQFLAKLATTKPHHSPRPTR